jgi:hypothetical protein
VGHVESVPCTSSMGAKADSPPQIARPRDMMMLADPLRCDLGILPTLSAAACDNVDSSMSASRLYLE